MRNCSPIAIKMSKEVLNFIKLYLPKYSLSLDRTYFNTVIEMLIKHTNGLFNFNYFLTKIHIFNALLFDIYNIGMLMHAVQIFE